MARFAREFLEAENLETPGFMVESHVRAIVNHTRMEARPMGLPIDQPVQPQRQEWSDGDSEDMLSLEPPQMRKEELLCTTEDRSPKENTVCVLEAMPECVWSKSMTSRPLLPNKRSC